MIKKIALIVLVVNSFYNIAYSQIKLKTYTEKIKNGYEIYADNDEYCDVSIKIDLTLKNMSSSEETDKVFVVPPRTKKALLLTLKSKKRGKYSYRYKTRYNLGNHLKKTYDDNYNYYLPSAVGEKFNVNQGYNGATTHKGKNALDFGMPVGTPIYAIRGGIVIKVVENHDKGCPDEICQRYNNKILICHEDGTIAGYVHLMKDGALVNLGDTIQKGQLIGKSGNTGWTSGPHLHLEVFQQLMGKRLYLKTKFKIDNGQKSILLKENSKYKRDYN